jgi:acetyl-CoA synthetase
MQAKPAAVDRYQELYQQFRWHVPADFNIARACCARWAAEPARIAIHVHADGEPAQVLTFAALQQQANRLANLLREHGVRRGDCVAIILPQRPETAIAHIACHQLGAIAMPLSVLFGPDALEYRLQHSQARLALVEAASHDNVAGIRANCPHLKTVIAIDCGAADTLDWQREMAFAPAQFDAVATKSSDAALLVYTSGTTGPPKGALLSHAALIGNLPGFVASQNWFPAEGDVFWSPADWAWTGGLMDALLPTLYFGHPIVSYRGRFSAETAFRLMEKYAVTNTFLFPTALKMMMKAYPQPRQHFDLKLRAIMSAGEAVGETVFNWGQSALGISINEMFGQTEMNYIVGNSAHKWPARAGSMGRPYPGHRVAVIDELGQPAAAGQVGEVAVHRCDIHGDPDPVFFIGYWNNPTATHQKYSGNWCRTGDLATIDADGYLWYQGRADDMFKAAGYRIGPSEIENCLIDHPSVVNAAVVPKPDSERGNLVKAFVVLTAQTVRSPVADGELVLALQQHVRGKLAPYEYPKEIEFLDQLPMTTTGKVQRRVLREMETERAAAAGMAASTQSRD